MTMTTTQTVAATLVTTATVAFALLYGYDASMTEHGVRVAGYIGTVIPAALVAAAFAIGRVTA